MFVRKALFFYNIIGQSLEWRSNLVNLFFLKQAKISEHVHNENLEAIYLQKYYITE